MGLGGRWSLVRALNRIHDLVLFFCFSVSYLPLPPRSSTEMSLKPRRIAFDEVWKELRETVQQVITLQDIKRDVWNNRFV